MGQVILRGGDYGEIAAQMERLVPVDIVDLGEGRQRYGFFTNGDGGIMDDLMLANRGDHLFVVVNAGCKGADIAHMKKRLRGVEVVEITERALLALQGPLAEAVLAVHVPDVAEMKFMDVLMVDSVFGELWISRSGYTGEDGYEISVTAGQAVALARVLVADERVEPIGLGARDSLRLEGGLCLYGHDIDASTSPVEAGLSWAMQKVRREGGARAGGFPGDVRILRELAEGAERKRVGLLPEGRAPMREGVALFADEAGGEAIGAVTSGAFGPTIGAPMAMGYVGADHAALGTVLWGEVRGKRMAVKVARMPFTPANFKR